MHSVDNLNQIDLWTVTRGYVHSLFICSSIIAVLLGYALPAEVYLYGMPMAAKVLLTLVFVVGGSTIMESAVSKVSQRVTSDYRHFYFRIRGGKIQYWMKPGADLMYAFARYALFVFTVFFLTASLGSEFILIISAAMAFVHWYFANAIQNTLDQ